MKKIISILIVCLFIASTVAAEIKGIYVAYPKNDQMCQDFAVYFNKFGTDPLSQCNIQSLPDPNIKTLDWEEVDLKEKLSFLEMATKQADTPYNFSFSNWYSIKEGMEKEPGAYTLQRANLKIPGISETYHLYKVLYKGCPIGDNIRTFSFAVPENEIIDEDTFTQGNGKYLDTFNYYTNKKGGDYVYYGDRLLHIALTDPIRDPKNKEFNTTLHFKEIYLYKNNEGQTRLTYIGSCGLDFKNMN